MYGRRTSTDHVLKRRPHQTTPSALGEGNPTVSVTFHLPTHHSQMDVRLPLTCSCHRRSQTTVFSPEISDQGCAQLMSSSGTGSALWQTPSRNIISFPDKNNDATRDKHRERITSSIDREILVDDLVDVSAKPSF